LGFFDDVGNFATQVVQNTVQAGGQLINSVTGAVGDTLQGGGINAISEKASKRFNQGMGAYGTVVGGSFLQTDAIKQYGSDPSINNLTLGFAGDAAGLGNLLKTSRETGAYSQDDLNSALRASGKAIAFGGAASLYNPGGLSLGEVSSLTSGSSGAAAWSVTDISLGTALGGYAVAKSVANNGADRVFQNFLSDQTGGLIPRTPINSPPLGGRAPASGSAAPQVSSPWQFADSGISGQSDAMAPLLMAGVAILAAYAYVRLSK